MLLMSTRGSRKRAYHHGNLPAATLRAAGELLEGRGADAVVLREVARRAGVSHNAPYRHYPDRGALLAALAAQGFQSLERSLSGRRGHDIGVAYVAFALEHPQRFRLMFGGALRLADRPALREAAARVFEVLRASFSGRGDVADPEKAAAAAWSLVHGLAQLLLEGQLPQALRKSGGAEQLAAEVIGAVRFAAGAQRSA
jgi:AcrR family transcriptional regulator